MVIKFVYTIFLALLIALFVGLGISAFYSGPKEPLYPVELEGEKPGCEETVELRSMREEFNRSQRDFTEKFKLYSRNVSIISISAAILILIVSLTLLSKIRMIADGILLGGVFTTVYSIIRGVMSEDTKFRFLIVTIGLLIALVLGYIKFIKPKEEAEKK
ncbi:MAG: hypothetical protein UX02_C0002G0204 [Candidatus Moranbacteria bacterium GW2011_GWC1_45_18]|nr:MAG: hypothetical protein UT79_C0001G0257 [Candidatus Moranbacteria bacterium GW2011_GWC2_40_12]KKT32181.1 MAG: hypothetical protein UW19_C0029G0003 [Candidatus Moranbacteria bacterium GW2011_GWF2_44_10]KKT99885.1 MAG: hypothetical protein UX02_C0002G0204 [Candidatus Moranbacteria bacterium GW2011_GWC1_45_18]OGI34395.1 MAG: hypothetical protein A2407_04520 [Candidatus Moranbacteria bacterium RIFOXYC1_FULL_44_8]OGI40773.1 MAG: hypothetical protein A2374_01950 [Candidatus Moranbacteria bacteri